MTREEAIAKLPEMEVRTRGDIIWLLDCLNILGLLTLDEPKSVEDEALATLVNTPVMVGLTHIQGRLSQADAATVIDRLRVHGFKITKA